MPTRYAPHAASYWTSSSLRNRGGLADTRLGRFFGLGATAPNDDAASSQGSLIRHGGSSTDSLWRGAVNVVVEESAVYAGGRRRALRKWLGIGGGRGERDGDGDGDKEGRGEDGDGVLGEELVGRRRRRWRFREYGVYSGLVKIVYLFGFVFFWMWKWVRRWLSPDRRARAARRRCLLVGLNEAFDYTEWYYIASELDALEGNAEWKARGRGRYATPAQDDSFDAEDAEISKSKRKFATGRIARLCDLSMLKGRLRELSHIYRKRDFRGLVFALRGSLSRNLAGMCHPELHMHSRVGTKPIVEDYVNVVSHLLKCIASAPPRNQSEERSATKSGLTEDEKLSFFNEARHAYGRTALMLSGGATLGLTHFGVVKALLDQNLLPKVVCGTSAGSLVGSYVGIFKDVELRSILESENMINPLTNLPFTLSLLDSSTLFQRVKRFISKGHVADVRILEDGLRKNFGDLTFEEAYSRTKRILNITVCSVRSSSDPPLLLNYLTAPHVLIWSAAAASCALPFVFAAVELQAKDAQGKIVPYQPDGIRWIDGSITSDIPLSRIGELFNVNHFIVSQTNPHLIPRGSALLQTRGAILLKAEFQFRYWQLMQLQVIPRLVSSIFPHFVQPYEGDVTIMPRVSFRDIRRLLTNPTREDVRDCIRRGEQQTFEKIDRIRLHCLIERTLEAAIESVAESMDIQQEVVSSESPELKPATSRFAGRVPSWLWLDSGSSPAQGKKKKGKEIKRKPTLSRTASASSQKLEGAGPSNKSSSALDYIENLLPKHDVLEEDELDSSDESHPAAF
eukprot:Plantae.Rhodophyta-Hildenbrandia_rubra.ctg8214.p1 GENE.Plantae.Rhodophyta-Hildenbrandia_rubra.ctg8214~~Plantae.Rhodophyta-Hildenbrandia_rubra.ctg8214.p1  ORF type:complete len:795 (-),score=164.91 Plantae.Rhodophyta-Hildenbrandia_rubra.ctg8214:6482-8866(-)